MTFNTRYPSLFRCHLFHEDCRVALLELPYIKNSNFFQKIAINRPPPTVIIYMIQPKNLCAVCGQISQRPFLPCNRCMERMLPPPWETCSYCSMDLAGTDNPCPVCRESELHPVDGIISWAHGWGPGEYGFHC